MSHSLALNADFYELSLNFKALTGQLHEALLKAGLEDFHIESWFQTADKYRRMLKAMPKELRGRPFVQEILKNLEDFEAEIKQVYAQKKLHASLLLSELQARVLQLSGQVGELEKNALIQKFLRGETVLSSLEQIQWGRKLGHAALGSFFLYLVMFSGWSGGLVWGIVGVFLVWAYALETSRHFSPKINVWVCRVFRPIMREREETKINSAMFYITAMMLVYFLCPREVAILTMLFIALGDPCASVVGLKFGSIKITEHCSLQGFLACFMVCLLSALLSTLFIFQSPLSLFALLSFSVLSGLIGALAESCFPKLDDNLVMPLISAPSLWLLMNGYGII